MRANRRRDTAPELAVRRELWARGHRYLVDATPAGTSRRRRADVVLRGARVAVFVDGCFWHSCPLHLHLPRSNRAWWEVKLTSITERDRRTDGELLAAGWLPVRIWEHEDRPPPSTGSSGWWPVDVPRGAEVGLSRTAVDAASPPSPGRPCSCCCRRGRVRRAAPAGAPLSMRLPGCTGPS